MISFKVFLNQMPQNRTSSGFKLSATFPYVETVSLKVSDSNTQLKL